MQAAAGELEALLDDDESTNLPDSIDGVMQYVGAVEQSVAAISYCLGSQCEFMTADLHNRTLVLIQKIPTLFTSDTMALMDGHDTHMTRTDKCL